ncbi:MAG: DUF4340 domain-containing protein [Halieaceae bacterium]|jgi:hypothetical protein|nr:DUF4340 domain-containing protein [Halieaceae bacterium]
MIRWLSALLLVQLVLVAALYWPKEPSTSTARSLVAFAADDIERISITDDEGVEQTLQRDGKRDGKRDDNHDDNSWRLPDGLPADSNRVGTLIRALTSADTGLAIATSDAAARRFEVDEDGYVRRLVLSTGEDDATVFLGSSPSFRKLHARRDGESEVYVVELNSYDAPTDEGSWLDKTLLAATQLDRIDLYGTSFERGDEAWTRSDGEAVDGEAMETLLQVLAGLRVTGIADSEDEDAAAAGESLRLDMAGSDGEWRLTVLDNPDSERYYLSSDRFEPVFDTSAYDAERLIEAARTVAGLADDDAAEADVDAEDASSGDPQGDPQEATGTLEQAPAEEAANAQSRG